VSPKDAQGHGSNDRQPSNADLIQRLANTIHAREGGHIAAAVRRAQALFTNRGGR